MAYVPLQALIDKQDNSEIVRDQIALILASESANQVTLAVAEPDPSLWKLRVYTERANPWESWVNLTVDTDRSPIVNIWLDNESFAENAGDVFKTQKATVIYNIDVYAVGVSASDGAGHTAGDQTAAENAQRAVRLVRNILMASPNAYLQLQGTVTKRWPQSINYFQPAQEDRPLPHIMGGRFALQVTFDETSPQYDGVTSIGIEIDIQRAEDGMVIAEADYPAT